MTPIVISSFAIILLIFAIYSHVGLYADMYKLPEWIGGVGLIAAIVIAGIAILAAFKYSGMRASV